MDIKTILTLVKARKGISTTVRDEYLTAIIKSVITEMEDEKAIILDPQNANHIQFIVDYSTWRYDSAGQDMGMPRYLQWRLHNLVTHNRKGAQG